jgi:hypothetical protein
MSGDRRGFLSWLVAGCVWTGLFGAGLRGQSPNPRSDPRPKDEYGQPPAPPPTKTILKENEKDIKKDIEKLYQLASDLKAEVEKTDSSQVLSLAMVRKAEEIEKLAKEIKTRAKG